MFSKTALRSLSSTGPVARQLARSTPVMLARPAAAHLPASSALLSRSFFGSSSKTAEETKAESTSTKAEAEPAEGAEGAKAAEGGASDSRIAELEKALEEEKKKSAEYMSKLKYMAADMRNAEQIAAREKAKTKEYAIEKFAKDLLATIDILTLALTHSPQPPHDNADLKTLYEGVDMTKKGLLDTLGRHGVTPIEPMGEKFDPNLHEALFMAPVEGKEVGTIMSVSQLGYKMKDRTLRAAQVGVVRAP